MDQNSPVHLAAGLHRRWLYDGKTGTLQGLRDETDMRRSSFSDAEIIDVVRALEAGRPAHELCDTWGISMRTLYRWRRKFSTLKPFAVAALRRLEQENLRLKSEAGQVAPAEGRSPQPAGQAGGVRSDLGGPERAPSGTGSPVVVGRYAALRVR